MTSGYPRYPAINGETVVFVAEDDLWSVSAEGGVARRLTAGVAAAKSPSLSPDSRVVAFTGAEEGPDEVYVLPVEGGQSRRLTFEGAVLSGVAGWDAAGESVIYFSSIGRPHERDVRLRRVSRHGGDSVELPYGWAASIARAESGAVVLGRDYNRDASHWKRYRGGRAGQLWIDASGDGEFRRLVDLDGNLSCPQIIGSRVFFLSDHEGYGNVYSTDFGGGDLRRHTDHDDFYARGLSGDGARLVYHCGGELYLLDPADDRPRHLDVQIGVTHTQRSRRFVDAAEYLESADITPDGSRLAIITRGKAFTLANWEGPVTQHGAADGVRYRLATWLSDGNRLVASSADNGPGEVLVVMTADGSAPPRRLDTLDVGRVHEIAASPTEAKVAVANHRNELLLIDLDAAEPGTTVLDSGGDTEVSDVTFSPDGAWLAYASADVDDIAEADLIPHYTLKLAEIATGRVAVAAEHVHSDFGPSFDPGGKYLYFIGRREFNPVYDALHFDLNFPLGSRPYAIALTADAATPFVPRPKPMHDKPDADNEPSGRTARVDLDGITRRIVPFPVDEAKYARVLGVDGKALVLSHPVRGGIRMHETGGEARGVLESVDLRTGKVERIADRVSSASVTADGKTLVYRSGNRLRVIKATGKAPDGDDTNRDGGWIDLSRVKVSVRPELEWPQMFAEAWRMLTEQFWTADMSGVDWEAIYDRYAPLLDRIATRGELSDLLWEMNGELGTSHAYESLGDYRPRPRYGQGFLGADFERADDGTYRIARIHVGDPWIPQATSPFNRPGVDARVGDAVLAVGGLPVDAETGIAQHLVNRADQEVELTLRRGDSAPHTVVVRALAGEQHLHYREWVDDNRRAVHEATDGRVGYLHIPDMGVPGYAEFHRGFLAEYRREALIVDARFNRGGHVSPLLLEKLARRRTGYSVPRRGRPVAYPRESPRGPMVALANENAGSDGDIFSHNFKQMGLGPLVGTRTWGGVVGLRPWRPRLVDKTWVVQPEIAFHFDDVGWGVENYGTAPDIEVDIAPQDYAAGRDPQLRTAIETALTELEKHPPHRFHRQPMPIKAPPPLPPRPQSAAESAGGSPD